jgi:hypothetical protein
MFAKHIKPGARFFHGSAHGALRDITHDAPFWMTTRIRTAADFGLEVSRVVTTKKLVLFQVSHLDLDGYVRDVLGLRGDPTMERVADVFCAEGYGFDGWHIPSFYGPGESDTMICRPIGRVKVDSFLTEAEVVRGL